MITIDRQKGSGGTEIAREVARKLKLSYFVKEAFRPDAADLGIAEKELARFDDKGIPE